MNEEKQFCSKILLFGEYSIIQQSNALSVPYPLFSGKLVFPSRDGEGKCLCNPELLAFAEFLKEVLKDNEAGFSFDYHSFLFDINQGLIFSSTIPQGFGVGSSGALVAAVFERYGALEKAGPSIGPNRNREILQLRDIFAMLESHFHGKSSGIDPLISYLNHPLLIRGKGDLGAVQLPNFKENHETKGAIFLLNTGRPRKTGPLVQLFLEKCRNDRFLNSCHDRLIPLTNSCIEKFLEGQWEDLYSVFNHLSQFQLEHFTPMIPEPYLNVWKKGLSHGDYHLKLCGAGGGGFLLGMTKDFQKTCELLSPLQLRLVFPL